MRFANALAAIFLLSCPFFVQAELVDSDDALQVGRNFLEYRIQRDGGWGDRAEARVLGVERLERGGRLLGYWIPVSPRGHLIVSPLRELPAIKAFSTETNFDPDAPGYADLIQDVFELTLDFLEETYGDLDNLPPLAAPAANRLSWNRLLSAAPGPREALSVGPMLQSVWHQGGPYNLDCPPGDGGTCVVGCVATAAAQILKYWEYPEMGEGSSSYTWGGDDSCGGSTAGGILEAQYWDPYDWDNILDSYSGGFTTAEADAVAELCYEMGVAFEMDYGVCGSGAYLTVSVHVYPDYFRYAESTEYVHRSQNSAEQWWQIIKTELDAVPPRPISYGIHSHAIVCDGYMEDGGQYYHMNYGWGGSANAWYALDNVYCPWDGCDYLVESMTIGIEPLGHFHVTQPAEGAVWTHGDALPEIAWYDSEASTVSVDLYHGDTRVTRILEGSPNDGSEIPVGLVDAGWGTGADYRLKVVDDTDKFGWSDTFSVYAPDQWSDASTDPVNDAGLAQAAAWGDVDGDGLPDLYLANKNDSNCLFRNLGGGLFGESAAPPIDVSGESQAAAWADIDNDGDLDLFLTRTDGQSNYLFRNDGGSFTDLTTPLLAGSFYSAGAVWGDYDADGFVDLYVTNVYAADRLFHNEGDGVFSEATAAPMGDAGFGRSASWTDFDGDGDLDLYLIRNNANRLYRNDGGGSFTLIASGPLADDGEGYGAAWGDYDNDGDSDLYLSNSGPNKLIRNEGGGTFTDVTPANLADDGGGRSAAWADYDNDGLLDLFLGNAGGNRLFHNEGGGTFAETTGALLGDDSDTRGAAWADFDGDGRVDLYLANYNAPNRLIRNESGEGAHWLHVDLAGNASNRAGLGAKLRLVAGGLIQSREVGSDTGYLSQSSLLTEFGLGGAFSIDSLLITWPSGAVNLLLDLDADQLINVEENDGATGLSEEYSPPFSLLTNFPNPFNPSTEILFELSEGRLVSLDVYDVNGRHIRNLACEFRAEGLHHVRWDGMNSQGRTIVSGVYFARLSGAKAMEERKMLLLK